MPSHTWYVTQTRSNYLIDSFQHLVSWSSTNSSHWKKASVDEACWVEWTCGIIKEGLVSPVNIEFNQLLKWEHATVVMATLKLWAKKLRNYEQKNFRPYKSSGFPSADYQFTAWLHWEDRQDRVREQKGELSKSSCCPLHSHDEWRSIPSLSTSALPHVGEVQN